MFLGNCVGQRKTNVVVGTKKKEKTCIRLLEEDKKAIEKDGTDGLVLGCTSLSQSKVAYPTPPKKAVTYSPQ